MSACGCGAGRRPEHDGRRRQLAARRRAFDRSATYAPLVQALRLRNLDAGALGPRHREDSLVLEPTHDHFAPREPARIGRQLEALLASLR